MKENSIAKNEDVHDNREVPNEASDSDQDASICSLNLDEFTNSTMELFKSRENISGVSEGIGARQKKYFEDEAAIGHFDPQTDQAPKFELERTDTNNRSGLAFSTPKPNHQKSLHCFHNLGISEVKKYGSNIRITGQYNPVNIDQHDAIMDDNIMKKTPQKLSKNRKSLFPEPNNNSILTLNKSLAQTCNGKTVNLDKSVAKVTPNYLKPTMSFVNKTNHVIGSPCAATLFASPSCKRMKQNTPAKNDRIVKNTIKDTHPHDNPKNEKIKALSPLVDLTQECDSPKSILKNIAKQSCKTCATHLILEPRQLIQPRGQPNRGSKRTRVQPLRPWFGEKAIYDYKGSQGLVGVTDVIVNDKRLTKKYA